MKKIATIEVKRDWNLNRRDLKAVKQAFGYAGEHGIRIVIVTNGDYYAIYDRSKEGFSYEDYFVKQFQLTRLNKDSLEVISWIKMLKAGRNEWQK